MLERYMFFQRHKFECFFNVLDVRRVGYILIIFVRVIGIKWVVALVSISCNLGTFPARSPSLRPWLACSRCILLGWRLECNLEILIF